MYEIITKEQIPEYEAFVQSHPKGNFAQSWLWSKGTSIAPGSAVRPRTATEVDTVTVTIKGASEEPFYG